jgi:predicted MPP superfamily phosphohydrolase
VDRRLAISVNPDQVWNSLGGVKGRDKKMAQRSGFVSLLIGFLSKLTLLLGLLALGAGIWGVMQEPGQLRYTQVKMKSVHWPLHWQPIRIAIVSDLHVGSPHIDLDKLETIVNLINSAEPDVVLLIGSFMPGDFFKTPISPMDFAPVLGKIEAKFGVSALLGRHDKLDGGKQLVDALTKQKINVLSNSAVPIKLAQKKRFWIVGFEDTPQLYETVMAKLPKGEPVFGMVHNPARFPDIPTKVELVFAGYTHGGLVVVPGFPLPILPTGVPEHYAYGHIRENERQMFVTAGIGTDVYPIRLNNKPEILLVTVVSGQ